MADENIPGPAPAAGLVKSTDAAPVKSQAIHHPSGKAGHGPIVKILRGIAFGVYFLTCCTTYASPCSTYLRQEKNSG